MVFGTAYALLGSLTFIVVGEETPGRDLSTYAKLMGLYLGGGAVAGLVLGLLRPFVRRRVGATLVGAIASTPIGVALHYLVVVPEAGREGASIVPTIFAVALLGALAGWKWWQLHDDEPPPGPSAAGGTRRNPKRSGGGSGTGAGLPPRGRRRRRP